jgi:hypothetical protein
MTYFAKNEIMTGYVELSQIALETPTEELRLRIRSVHGHFSRASRWFLPMKYLISSGILENESLLNGYHALYAGSAVAQILVSVDDLRTEFIAEVPGTPPTGYLDLSMLFDTKVSITEFFKDHR